MRKERMIKRAILGLTVAALMSLTVPALAQSYTGGSGWNVTFDQNKKMVSSFHTSDMDETLSYLQPGDDATFTVSLKNSNSATTDWYMTNKVLYSLEDRSANSKTGGGAYTYRLVYTDQSGKDNVLFDSDTVGGETVTPAGEGLHEATNALEDYFYLDTLKNGQGGTITLVVALDGETQGNDYQDTLADLQMNFAVELTDEGGVSKRTINRSKVVKTGDQNMAPYAIVGGVAGIVLLLLAIFGAKRRKKEQEAAKARVRSGEGAKR